MTGRSEMLTEALDDAIQALSGGDLAGALVAVQIARAQARSSNLTDGQTAALVEYLVHGSHREAAACLGISPQTIKNQLSVAIHRTGAHSATQIPYLLGWLTIPERWAHKPKAER